MPKQSQLSALLDRFIDQFASAIAARAEEKLSRVTRASGGGKATAGTRMCPYPGCKNAGAGPRNRWFCRDHARSVPVREQKRILAERAKSSGGAALVLKRRGPAKGRKLDMSCRVEGCKNTSRGPRFGFICDEHRKKLNAREQLAAREKWKTAHAKAA
jgi:hypothetical protein